MQQQDIIGGAYVVTFIPRQVALPEQKTVMRKRLIGSPPHHIRHCHPFDLTSRGAEQIRLAR